MHSLSHIPIFGTPRTAACQASLSFTISWSLLKLISIELLTPPNHLVLYHPLVLLPSIFLSMVFHPDAVCSFRVLSNESALLNRWPKYWSFSISSSNEWMGSTSFRIDCFDLLAVQETLKNFLQHHSSKSSILWYLAFFMVQLSHPYILEKP